jgi:hypothetical protein
VRPQHNQQLFCDVIIDNEQTAQTALIKTINDILNSDSITMDHLPELTSALGESNQPLVVQTL